MLRAARHLRHAGFLRKRTNLPWNRPVDVSSPELPRSIFSKCPDTAVDVDAQRVTVPSGYAYDFDVQSHQHGLRRERQPRRVSQLSIRVQPAREYVSTGDEKYAVRTAGGDGAHIEIAHALDRVKVVGTSR
jgi:hypothetical protein